VHTRGRASTSGGALSLFSSFNLVLWGLLVALGFSFLFLALNAILILFTPLSEVFVPYLLFAGTLFSVLLGAVFIGKRTEEKGWLRGGLMGFFYVLVLLCLSYFWQIDFQPGWGLLTKFFLGFSFGAAGGIWGINS